MYAARRDRLRSSQPALRPATTPRVACLARGARKVPGPGQGLVATQHKSVAAGGVAVRIRRDGRAAVEETWESHGCFEPGQVVADAHVRAGTEAERFVAGACRIEAVGTRVPDGVAVGCSEQQDHVAAVRDGDVLGNEAVG